MAANRSAHELRSFARRRARTLTQRQQRLLTEELPRFALDPSQPAPGDLTQLFDCPVREVWIEIGFGGGEHLVWQAAQNPDIGILGCEPFIDGTVKVLSEIEERGLSNIRLYGEDGRDILHWAPYASLSRAFILFPDPWPKKRHAKRRLINAATLRLLVQAMRPGAELRVATDIGDYARTMLLALGQVGELCWTATRVNDWRIRPNDWPATRYQRKAEREGRRSYYFSIRRT